jgi:phage tail-like protein
MTGTDPDRDAAEREFVAQIDGHDFSDPDRFGVQIDGVEVEGWQRIDLPQVSTGRSPTRSGDATRNGNEGADRSDTTPLELERAVGSGDDGYVWDWVNDVRQGKVAESRRDIRIILEDADGNPLTRWEVTGCRPERYDPPDLDASADGEGSMERLTVSVSEFANRAVERICGHGVDEVIRVFSQSTEDLPGTVRGLVTDSTIHLAVDGDDDGDYTVRTGPDREIETVIDRKPSTPDLVVETNCRTLTEVVTADDPQSSFRSSYEDGDVRVRGTGVVSGFVTGIARTVTRISDALGW